MPPDDVQIPMFWEQFHGSYELLLEMTTWSELEGSDDGVRAKNVGLREGGLARGKGGGWVRTSGLMVKEAKLAVIPRALTGTRPECA